MHPLGLLKKTLEPSIVDAEVSSLRDKLAAVMAPVCAILFGSAAEERMTDQSDIDVLLVFKNIDDLRAARKAVSRIAPLSKYPVDLVYVLEVEYLRKRHLGGICMIAHESGRVLIGSDPQ